MFTLEQGPQGEAKRYELSCPTASLDAFLSHDWASNARLKVLSLVIIYNSRAAFLACLAVSILVGVLRAEGLLPSEIWMATFGHLSFFFVLALWQRIRMLFCRPQLVFLDKLCISQQDEQCFGGVSKKASFFQPSGPELPVVLSKVEASRHPRHSRLPDGFEEVDCPLVAAHLFACLVRLRDWDIPQGSAAPNSGGFATTASLQKSYSYTSTQVLTLLVIILVPQQ